MKKLLVLVYHMIQVFSDSALDTITIVQELLIYLRNQLLLQAQDVIKGINP
jgi:hypothetical protein